MAAGPRSVRPGASQLDQVPSQTVASVEADAGWIVAAIPVTATNSAKGSSPDDARSVFRETWKPPDGSRSTLPAKRAGAPVVALTRTCGRQARVGTRRLGGRQRGPAATPVRPVRRRPLARAPGRGMVRTTRSGSCGEIDSAASSTSMRRPPDRIVIVGTHRPGGRTPAEDRCAARTGVGAPTGHNSGIASLRPLDAHTVLFVTRRLLVYWANPSVA